jgi:hypothetical protein
MAFYPMISNDLSKLDYRASIPRAVVLINHALILHLGYSLLPRDKKNLAVRWMLLSFTTWIRHQLLAALILTFYHRWWRDLYVRISYLAKTELTSSTRPGRHPIFPEFNTNWKLKRERNGIDAKQLSSFDKENSREFS